MGNEREILMYAEWRFLMWIKGYGSYVEIEERVSGGELTPGVDYPDLSTREKP